MSKAESKTKIAAEFVRVAKLTNQVKAIFRWGAVSPYVKSGELIVEGNVRTYPGYIGNVTVKPSKAFHDKWVAPQLGQAQAQAQAQPSRQNGKTRSEMVADLKNRNIADLTDMASSMSDSNLRSFYNRVCSSYASDRSEMVRNIGNRGGEVLMDVLNTMSDTEIRAYHGKAFAQPAATKSSDLEGAIMKILASMSIPLTHSGRVVGVLIDN